MGILSLNSNTSVIAMPIAQLADVNLYYEIDGAGQAVVFIHELAGDYRSWEPQARAFARRWRCVVYSARGYLPSSIPQDGSAYSQKQAAADAIGLLDALGIQKAHFVGLSMGGFATTQIGLDFPERVLSLTIASCGSGSERHLYAQKQAAFHAMSEEIREQGVQAFVRRCEHDATRESFQRRDPRGWREFCRMLGEHDDLGMSHTLRHVQGARPSLWDFESRLAQVQVPVLVMCGDQDEPCLMPSLFLARTFPQAQLAVLPGCGHVLNLEEPDEFNRILGRFLESIDVSRQEPTT